MIQHYMKIIFRNLKRNKAYSFLNIFGMTLGMTCFLLIYLYVQYELSYDRYHKNGKNIYRIIHHLNYTFKYKNYYAQSPANIAPILRKEFPEVISAGRLVKRRPRIQYEDKLFFEDRFYFSDPEILEIFSFPLIRGEAISCLNTPYTVFISEAAASKLFGSEDPLGKTIRVDENEYLVKGILKDVPENSHFGVDFLASLSSYFDIHRESRMGWHNFMYQTYLLLHPETNTKDFESRLPGVFRRYNQNVRDDEYPLQHLYKIHFFNQAHQELEPNTDIRNIYFFSIIAFLILFISCINYMNLSTAKSIKRAKEVGLRKVVGAQRLNLFRQYLGESMVFSSLSLCFSIICVRLLLPAYSAFIGRPLSFNLPGIGEIILVLLFISLFTGIVSGSYPAFVLSSFQPVNIFKGTFNSRSKGSSKFRNSLIFVQFVFSILLIICSIVVTRQLHFIKNKELGFQKENVVVVPVYQPQRNYQGLLDEFRKNPNILDITTSNTLPINMYSARGGMTWEGKKADDSLILYILRVDGNYLDFYNHRIVKGRRFSVEDSDSQELYILNETAVKSMGWKNPIGKRFENGVVIGVVEDFHFAPLHQGIESLVIRLNRTNNNRISLRISSENFPQILAFIKTKWQKFFPEYPYSHYFLDERIENLYQNEHKLEQLFLSFTILTILIACLGLSGLTSLAAEERVKEIGIRKVLGASAAQIMAAFSFRFLKWILISNLFAWPIAYIVLSKWLQNFAYRINLGIMVFILSGLSALAVALLTIGLRSFKAAAANPIDSIRYE